MKAILTKNVNLRKTPQIAADNILKTVTAQSVVEILIPDSAGWTQVSVDNIKGFMSSQFLSVVPETVDGFINRDFLYETIRKNKLFPKITAKQKEGIEATLVEWEYWVKNGWVDNDYRKLAYILATDYHESAKTMQPIKEYGGNSYYVKLYWTNKKKRLELGNRTMQDAIDFCGKGKPMITGYSNYLKMEKILGYPLSKNPDLMLTMKVATEVMFEGMLTGKSFAGDFTNRHLGQYFNSKTNNPLGARAIINGVDDDNLIEGYHYKFLEGLVQK